MGFAFQIRPMWSAASRPRTVAPSIGSCAAILCAAIGVLLQPALAQQPGGAKNAAQPKTESADPSAPLTSEKPTPGAQTSALPLREVIEKIAASGRVLEIGETSSSRLTPAVPLAPGAPPILAFRYFDGQARHRFGDLDLVMDDAGH